MPPAATAVHARPRLAGSTRARAGARAWPVLGCLAAVYAALLAVALAGGDVRGLVHVGRRTLHSAATSSVITPALGWQSRLGYDGQYYYFLALDPRRARDYMGAHAGYVYARPLYPALTRAASLGSPARAPYAMLGINLLAVGAGTAAVALWLRRRGLSTWYALLYGLYPGLVFSVFRDLTEPLALGLAALAVAVFDARSARRTAAAAAILALALLARETVLPFALAAAAALVAQRRRDGHARARAAWGPALAFAAATVGPLLAWRAVVGAYVHRPVQERTGGVVGLVPFHGLASQWPWDREHLLVVGAVVLPALLAASGAVLVLRRDPGSLAAWLLLANAAAFVVFLPAAVDVDYGGAGRAALGVVLATLYCLPALRRLERPRFPALLAATTWSLPWFLLVSALVGAPGLTLITS